MSQNPLAVLCLRELTRLLDFHSLEMLVGFEESKYVVHNVNAQSWLSDSKYRFDVSSSKKGCWNEKISFETMEKIKTLIDHLRKVANTEGLFRISGNKKRQDELKMILSKGHKLERILLRSTFNAHDVASVLKQYFNDLEEPLMTKELYDCYQQVAEMDGNTACAKKKEALQFLFLLLPPVNRYLLQELLDLLSLVASFESSKMTAFNLGLVFAPSIVFIRERFCCLNEVSVEPLTELVTFLINNAHEVFQIPPKFMTEAEKYLKAIDSNKSNDEVPMTKTFCERINTKEFHRQAQVNTQDAVITLYAQVMDMPDGPRKKELLHKFEKSYPGTPIYVPKEIKERAESLGNGLDCEGDSVQNKPLKYEEDISRSFFRRSVRKALSEPVLTDNTSLGASMQVKTSHSARSDPFPQKEYSNEHLKYGTPCHQHNPSTPGSRVKQCFNRIRRRSVEMFKLKPSTSATPNSTFPEDISIQNNSSFKSKVKDMFRKSQRLSNKSHSKLMKKSISTPAISSCTQDEIMLNDVTTELERKLSFSEDNNLDHIDRHPSDDNSLDEIFESTRISNTSIGLINPAFCDNPAAQSNHFLMNVTTTPVIKKTLLPCRKNDEVKENIVEGLKLKSNKEKYKNKHSFNKPIIVHRQFSDITNKATKNTLV